MIHLFTWLMMLTLIVILVQPKFKFNCQIFTPLIKACGRDEIHRKVLKSCSPTLSHPLSLLFKLSYNTLCVPGCGKLPMLCPFTKKEPGITYYIENYMLISLTSLVMKTYEKTIKDELLLKTIHLLDSRQHGFLHLESCTTNMTVFSDSTPF